jgi:hypothetical protein
MNGKGNNGNGHRFGALRRWLAPSVNLDKRVPASVRIGELNYPTQLKRGGGF